MHKSAPGVGAQEHIVRPQPVNLRSKRSPRRFAEGVAEAKEVPGDVSEIRCALKYGIPAWLKIPSLRA